MSLQKNNFKEKLCAIILCAGEGKRLKQITKSLPKPLIKIETLNNISIINHIINILIKLKIQQIAIVTGYLGEAIQEHISSITKHDDLLQKKIFIIDSENQYKLGPLYSFLSIAKNSKIFTVNKYYIVIPGDTIFHIEILKELLLLISKNDELIFKCPFAFYRNIDLKALKRIYKRNTLISYAKIKKIESGTLLKRITKCKLKDLIPDNIIHQILPVFTFNYNFIREILDLKKSIRVNTIWETINYMVDRGMKIYAFRVRTDKNFFDIDTENDLRTLKKKDNRRSDYSQ